MTEEQNTIGDFRFGLETAEDHTAYAESLYRSIEELKELGELPEGTTFYAVADAFLDTVINYSGLGPISAAELSDLVRDAVEQLEAPDLDFDVEE